MRGDVRAPAAARALALARVRVSPPTRATTPARARARAHAPSRPISGNYKKGLHVPRVACDLTRLHWVRGWGFAAVSARARRHRGHRRQAGDPAGAPTAAPPSKRTRAARPCGGRAGGPRRNRRDFSAPSQRDGACRRAFRHGPRARARVRIRIRSGALAPECGRVRVPLVPPSIDRCHQSGACGTCSVMMTMMGETAAGLRLMTGAHRVTLTRF